MKEYFHMSSTFIIVAVVLFCLNRVCGELNLMTFATTFNMVGTSELSSMEIFTYIASAASFVVGLVFLFLGLKERNK